MNEKVIIIDDDEKLNKLLINYFKQFHFTGQYFTEPLKALSFLKNNQPDIIILDIMLPQTDGFSVLKKLRESSQIPVIMLTARGDVTDKIVGLEMGADDYLSKPFEPRELVARIQTILRRTKQTFKTSILCFNGLKLDLNKRIVFLNKKEINLTTLEFEILALLAKQPQRVYNRDQIQEKIKGYEWETFDRSIDVCISRLRQKLNDDPKNPVFIKTIWGTGYTFISQPAGGQALNGFS